MKYVFIAPVTLQVISCLSEQIQPLIVMNLGIIAHYVMNIVSDLQRDILLKSLVTHRTVPLIPMLSVLMLTLILNVLTLSINIELYR